MMRFNNIIPMLFWKIACQNHSITKSSAKRNNKLRKKGFCSVC